MSGYTLVEHALDGLLWLDFADWVGMCAGWDTAEGRALTFFQ